MHHRKPNLKETETGHRNFYSDPGITKNYLKLATTRYQVCFFHSVQLFSWTSTDFDFAKIY